MSSLVPATTALAQLVSRYHVCWEVWPEYALIGQKSRQVGFELELLGSDKDLSEFAPVCRKAMEIHAALEAVARWALVGDEQVSCEISPPDTSLRYSSVRENRPDVTLSIKILHRTGFDVPVDDNERDYLEKAKARLRQLGACEHRWYFAKLGSGGELAAV